MQWPSIGRFEFYNRSLLCKEEEEEEEVATTGFSDLNSFPFTKLVQFVGIEEREKYECKWCV